MAITVGLFLVGEFGIALFSAYFLVIIGNGCRHGRGASHVCQSLCLIGLVSVVLYASWWPNNPKVWAGLFVMLLIVPLYVSGLLRSLASRPVRNGTRSFFRRALSGHARSEFVLT